MALPLHTGGGKPEGHRSKITYLLVFSPHDFVSVRIQSAQQPKKSRSEAPKLNDQWSKTTAGTSPFEKILPVSNEKCKTGQRPPQIRRKTQNGEGLLSAFRPEIKKMAKRRNIFFSTLHFSD
ncbi:hypothetical protein AVEN_143476-1 [Araneus ventricosus]|uniref:Uncharacterized protein n=1 Tax=Araneus ventricosus TaxID=182803 RepID=A0A4Y2J2S8_ARAVE|nr:hypothetical protein AVEN_143476-1 [Araneus ventricosus]